MRIPNAFPGSPDDYDGPDLRFEKSARGRYAKDDRYRDSHPWTLDGTWEDFTEMTTDTAIKLAIGMLQELEVVSHEPDGSLKISKDIKEKAGW